MTNTLNVVKVRAIIKGKASGKDFFYSAPQDIKIGDCVEVLVSTFKKHSNKKMQETVRAIVVNIEDDNFYIDNMHPVIGLAALNDICNECETIPCVCGVEL